MMPKGMAVRTTRMARNLGENSEERAMRESDQREGLGCVFVFVYVVYGVE